jgi:hypothetical protein
MTTTELTYRLYEDTDFGAIMQLWEQYSGWGAISEEQFRRWYIDTPNGPCIVIVAIDETDCLVGQLVFTPAMVNIKAIEVKALRAGAPILHESLKRGKLLDYDHPTFAMVRKGMEVARERGFVLIYSLPAVGWTALLRAFPKMGLPAIEVVSYDCFGILLHTKPVVSRMPGNCLVKILDRDFTEEYNELWSEAVAQFPLQCCVVRSAAWLKWKLGQCIVFEVREKSQGKLKGYVALKQNSGLLVDMLARNSTELKEVLSSVTWALNRLNPDCIEVPFNKITGMYTPVVQAILSEQEIEFENFSFAFGCYPLKEEITHEQIDPANWYIMPND